MKKIFFLFVLLCIPVIISAQTTPDNDQNYVYSTICLTADCIKKTETIQYMDGLGRPKQILNVKSSPSEKDVVTHMEYDALGRQIKEYLPVPQAGTSHGSIYTHPLSYASHPDIYGSEKIYAEKSIEFSPLNRVLQQIQPGTDWENHPIKYSYLTNNSTDVLKFTTITETLNGANYIQTLKIEDYYPAKMLYKNKVIDEDGNAVYEFKNTQGQTLLIRKVLGNEAGMPQGSGIVPESVTQYLDTYYVYNEYNQLVLVIPPMAAAELKSNPIQTISDPSENTVIKNLCYQYRYDHKERLVEKKLPGKGWEYMVYDLQDRLIMTQDANLAAYGHWLFTKYDQLGRPAYSGLCNSDIPQRNSGNIVPDSDRKTQQDFANGMGSNNVSRSNFDEGEFSGLNLYYTVSGSYPLYSSILKLLTVNYYDTYLTGNDNASQGGTPLPEKPSSILSQNTLGDDILQNRSTKGLPTASYVNLTGEEDGWTKTFLWYDELGRNIGTHTINHLGGSTMTRSLLDFAGAVQKTETWHKKISSELPVYIIEDFVYDHQNRLTKHYHEVSGKTDKVLLAENVYDEIGRLVTKKVGAVSDENFIEVAPALQTINYSYNIRSWMTGINLTAGEIDNTQLFSYKLRYNDPVNTAIKRYNGNIAETDWAYNGESTQRYEYTYDHLNRLKKANYKSVNLTETLDSKYYNEQLTYDLNGNILSLKRNARPLTGQTAVLVDNLIYQYEEGGLSNRLSTVYDHAQNMSGYPAAFADRITYDDNGNMLTMPDKGITEEIVYNYLNLPQTIIHKGNPVTYTYRADGVKIHKNFNFNEQDIATDYLDGFVYTTPYTEGLELGLLNDPEVALAGQQDAMELAQRPIIIGPGNPSILQSSPNFFPTAEGFYDYENFRYIYQYKDHLGNVRLSYVKDVDTGEAIGESSNDYYPFGLNFINILPRTNQPVYYNPSVSFENYKYNGKELEETGMYDYGARFYMPDIGRWITPDPLLQDLDFTFNPNQANEDDEDEIDEATARSLAVGDGIFNPNNLNPYAYGYNDPVRYNDPDGKCPICIFVLLAGFGILDAPSRDVQSNQAAKQQMTNLRNQVFLTTLAPGSVTSREASVVLNAAKNQVQKQAQREVQKTYQTYTKDPKNPKDGVYSGKTSGTKSPQKNVENRDKNHHMNKTHGPAKLDRSTKNENAQKGREQQLVKQNGGAKSQGGTSGNQRNAVGPKNPNAQKYENAANKEFGTSSNSSSNSGSGSSGSSGGEVIN